MVRNPRNVFEDSDSSIEEEPVTRIPRQPKPLKIPHLNDSESSSSIDNATDDDEDYMAYDVDYMEQDDDTKRDLKQNLINRTTDESHDINLTTSLFDRNKDSVGLSIMKKMGFKVGDALGSPSTNPMAIDTPITVERKERRHGIGGPDFEKGTDVLQTFDTSEYTSHIGLKVQSKRLKLVVWKLKKLCFELSGDSEKFYDSKNNDGLLEVNELWRDYVEKVINSNMAKKPLKPPTTDNDNKSIKTIEGEIDAYGDTQQRLLSYLREEHFYCWYCGCVYLNSEDLNKSCPGIYEESHAL